MRSSQHHSHKSQNTKEHDETRSKAGKRVSLVGALTNTGLSVLKIITGNLGGSAALVADGFHSLSDVLSDVMVWLVFGAAQKQPDRQHPWGHRRFETIATILLALILALVAASMTWQSSQALWLGEPLHSPALITAIAAAISIIVNEWLYWYTLKVGKQVNSQLLIANAWHHRSDGWSSIVVLLAILGAMAGYWWLDALAAIVVALVIGKIALSMLLNSITELVDTAVPPAQEKHIRELALQVEGVQSVHSLKTRGSGGATLLEIHIRVRPHTSAAEGHFIGEQVRQVLLNNIADLRYVIYHIDVCNDAEHQLLLSWPIRAQIAPVVAQAITTAILAERLTHGEATSEKMPVVEHHIDLFYLPNALEIDIKLSVAITDKSLHVYQQVAAEITEEVKSKLTRISSGPIRVRLWLALPATT
ncbi:cation diffusion facilitator family transporter [Aliidiomarina sp.]|uniref:cation diffusion facilitator family transporter n=1 Tax=Aliidiomarina sp. TaxID=1872439 RepID=UPI003A4D6130